MDQRLIAISVLRDELQALENRCEQLRGVILQLECGSSRQDAQSTPAAVSDRAALNEMFIRLEAIDLTKFPVERMKGLPRIEIAKAIADRFQGYVSTSAFRKVLSQPGVLKSARQVGSVASRVLMQSDEFDRLWEGLYRLKQATEKEVPSEEKTSF